MRDAHIDEVPDTRRLCRFDQYAASDEIRSSKLRSSPGCGFGHADKQGECLYAANGADEGAALQHILP